MLLLTTARVLDVRFSDIRFWRENGICAITGACESKGGIAFSLAAGRLTQWCEAFCVTETDFYLVCWRLLAPQTVLFV